MREAILALVLTAALAAAVLFTKGYIGAKVRYESNR